MSRRVSVAIVNDYEVVVQGVAALLQPFDEIDLVVLAAGAPVEMDVDVALYDTFGSADAPDENLLAVIDHPLVSAVAVYTTNFEEPLIEAAFARGATGYIHKGLPAAELVDALVRIHGGEKVIAKPWFPVPEPERRWPGKLHDLTEREANVLALITQGLDNRTIADRLYVSVDAIKSRIKGLYRKIGVNNRTEAALWGVRHGFDPDHVVLWEER